MIIIGDPHTLKLDTNWWQVLSQFKINGVCTGQQFNLNKNNTQSLERTTTKLESKVKHTNTKEITDDLKRSLGTNANSSTFAGAPPINTNANCLSPNHTTRNLSSTYATPSTSAYVTSINGNNRIVIRNNSSMKAISPTIVSPTNTKLTHTARFQPVDSLVRNVTNAPTCAGRDHFTPTSRRTLPLHNNYIPPTVTQLSTVTAVDQRRRTDSTHTSGQNNAYESATFTSGRFHDFVAYETQPKKPTRSCQII